MGKRKIYETYINELGWFWDTDGHKKYLYEVVRQGFNKQWISYYVVKDKRNPYKHKRRRVWPQTAERYMANPAFEFHSLNVKKLPYFFVNYYHIYDKYYEFINK